MSPRSGFCAGAMTMGAPVQLNLFVQNRSRGLDLPVASGGDEAARRVGARRPSDSFSYTG